MFDKTKYPGSLSLILPLYNESQRFKEQIKSITKLHDLFSGWEIIFINDGSVDNTKEIVTGTIKAYKRMKLISYETNRGKGYAIKEGVKEAKNELILFSDIDFSTPITELELFIPFVNKGADVVIGTRKAHGAEITVHQTGFREWMGRRFTQLSNNLLGMDISDFTCGFKLFRKHAAKKLFSNMHIHRWGFDSEILYLAHKFGFKVVEVPVVWQNDARTKVNLAKDAFRSLSELINIRWYDVRGKYQ